jgi:Type I restriction-modification system methyltransferase subunit
MSKMKKYEFYTPVQVADFLIKMIDHTDCQNIIDICCGSWNLLRSAKKYFPNAHITGVDVDGEAERFKLENADFYKGDGREFALDCINESQKYDLVLSNPPFGYLEEEMRLYAYSNDSRIDKKLINKRYENEILQANLLLAKQGGTLLFILPSTFIEGISNKKIRKVLGNKYNICSLFQLPKDIFGAAEISTWAMWLKNTQPDDKCVHVYEVEHVEDGYMQKEIKEVDREYIKSGNWLGSNEKYRRNSLNIYRGTLHSKEFSDNGNKVLHCGVCDSGKEWRPSLRFCRTNVGKKAKQGDIIINRIGKSAGYWCVNDEEEILVSDCIIVIKSESDYLIKKLEEQSENHRLKIPVYGTTTQYITVEDIKKLDL